MRYPASGSWQLHKSNYGMILSSVRHVSICPRNSSRLPHCIAECRIILSGPIYASGGPQVPNVLSEKYFLLVFSNLVSDYFYCIVSSRFLYVLRWTEFGRVPQTEQR